MGVTTSESDGAGPLTRALADELRAEMAVQKMSRPALAKATGIGNRSLQRYLNAERTFSLEVLDTLAGALGTTSLALVTAAEQRRVPPSPPVSRATNSA